GWAAGQDSRVLLRAEQGPAPPPQGRGRGRAHGPAGPPEPPRIRGRAMSRLFWLGLGAALGVTMARRASRAARPPTPRGFGDDLVDALRGVACAVGSFGADVRAGMAERERELHRMVDERTGISTSTSTSARARGAAD